MITKIIKRDGTEVDFNAEKIWNAISKANAEVETKNKINDLGIDIATKMVVEQLNKLSRAIEVEEIQEIVETELMKMKAYEVAKCYIRYRYDHKLKMESDTDKKILSLVEYNNEAVKQENSNKDPEIIPTQRDYIAGEISKDITMRKLLPEAVVKAHNDGLIHFHDSDYFIQHSHNCCLVNLEDMLQKRHCDIRYVDRKASYLQHRLQHCDTDYRTGSKFPVRRTVYQSGTSGSVCG